MEQKITILGIPGSLRKGSFNKALLEAATELLPNDAVLEIFGLDGIPLYNQDLEKDPPERVRQFKEKIKAADALLLATPEYNYSIPGVLKNAIDWASRPHGNKVFHDKPLAIMGASMGMFGSARAQYHLRQCFISLNAHILNQPEIMVPSAHDKIDVNGRLTDEKTRGLIGELLVALVAWTRRLKF
ncbi:MAG: NAD(P)H-dependent oxidoreductase [Nitrospirae bacterium]|nr:NAD(P)H-dependent oxidoreductase [Nitrospirota bacterium]